MKGRSVGFVSHCLMADRGMMIRFSSCKLSKILSFESIIFERNYSYLLAYIFYPVGLRYGTRGAALRAVTMI
jgi:hypothetical protein